MKTKIYVEEYALPDSLQTEIIARFLKPHELKEFWDSYKENRKKDKAANPPTEAQYRLAKLRRKMSIKDIAKQEKVETFTVLKALSKVATWEYLNS